MKIAVDLTPVEVAPAGIGQYTINLISKLLEIDNENEYLLYSTTPMRVNSKAKNIVIPQPKSKTKVILPMIK